MPLANGCNPDEKDCNKSKCDLLKEKIESDEGDRVDEDLIYEEKEICTDSMSQEAKIIFPHPMHDRLLQKQISWLLGLNMMS